MVLLIINLFYFTMITILSMYFHIDNYNCTVLSSERFDLLLLSSISPSSLSNDPRNEDSLRNCSKKDICDGGLSKTVNTKNFRITL